MHSRFLNLVLKKPKEDENPAVAGNPAVAAQSEPVSHT